MMRGNRLSDSGTGIKDLARQGYRLFVDPATPMMAAFRAPRQFTGTDTERERNAMRQTIDLEPSLAIDRQTVER